MKSANIAAFKAFAALALAPAAVQLGYVLAVPASLKALEDEKLVEGNPSITGPDGQIAYRLTDTGKAEATKQGVTAPAVGGFVIKTGVAVPTIARNNAAVGKYPLDQLPQDGSFFIVPPADMKSPSKTLGSMVASYNKKYRKEADFRLFTIRSVADGANWDQPGVKGIAVFRANAADEAKAKAEAKAAGKLA